MSYREEVVLGVGLKYSDDVKQVRNKLLVPDLRKEGIFLKDIHLSTKSKHGCPWGDRLYSHHTLASARRMSFYYPYDVPQDSLDIILNSTYNHSQEKFPDKEDIYLQPESHGCDTWRRIRNTFDKRVVVPMEDPVQKGGIKEKINPFNIKLMNSGVHSSQTNPGYSRKAAGGAIFFY